MALIKTKKLSSTRKLDDMKKELLNPRQKRNLNLWIDADLVKKFKTKTTQNDTNMSEVMTKFIIEYVKS